MSSYHITGELRAWRLWREQGQHKQATDTVAVDIVLVTDLDERWATRHVLWQALNDGGYDHGQWEAPPAVAEVRS